MIAPLDPAVAQAARERIDQLTKPQGSLGRIEMLAVQLCAIAGGIPRHNYERRAILIGAADHGVAASGVSAYPAEVTAQMVGGFLAGTAAISAFARAARAEVFVANFGVGPELPAHDRLIDVSAGRGTGNLAEGPAIARERVPAVLQSGRDAYAALRARVPFDVLALGDMGIGNTTSAAAIVAAFTGSPAAAVAGRGTGVDDAGLRRKIAAIDAALERCSDFTWEEVASEMGGYEIVGLAGVMLAAAEDRVPIVLDGAIVTAAALLAADVAPEIRAYFVAAHRSPEPAHAIALDALRLEPLLDLELRLGEASGAALALPLVEAAARMVREMKTFAEAGVSTA